MPVACPRREVRSGCAARTASAQADASLQPYQNAEYRKVLCDLSFLHENPLKGKRLSYLSLDKADVISLS